MRITITGINFIYDDGHDKEYTGVKLQYITSGFQSKRDNPIQITKEQYEENKGNSDGLRALIVDNKLEEANEYIESLNEYKESLNAK